MKKWCKRVLIAGLIVGSGCGLLIAFAAWRVPRSAEGRLFDDAAAVPARRAALVLGCVRELPNGRPNQYFRLRVKAAVELFQAGRVEHLLVSGDNHRRGYDEPSDLKEALMAAGVPEDRVTCDYAGFRTLDSVVRAKEVFGLDSFVVVSQPFHNERAIFLARAKGIDAVGFNAGDVAGRDSLRTRLREHLARVAALLDVWVWHRQPRFLGPRVELGSQTASLGGNKTRE